MKKIYLLILVFSFTTKPSFSQTGLIRGVVTYYFNSNFGYKPDIGATIAIVNQNKIEPFFQELNNCSQGNENISVEIDEAELLVKKMQKEYNSLPMFGSSKKLKIAKSKLDSAKSIYNQKVSISGDIYGCKYKIFGTYVSDASDFEKTIIDGNGNYSFKLNAGNYLVLIASKQSLGKVMKKVTVVSDKELNFSYQFDKSTEFNILY